MQEGMKKKVICVFGTRPEAIKMAPLVHNLKKDQYFNTKVIITAQHRHMLDEVLGLFKIKPDYDLNIMINNQTLYHVSNMVLKGVGQILNKEKPDMVLVHGDTTTAFMSSLAAYYERIPVGHVEAGLRSFDKYNPFPEELNRKLVGSLSDLHFAPTKIAKNNLIRENLKNNIIITGNTVVDALFYTVKSVKKSSIIKKLKLKSKKIILVTVHRRENFGIPFKNICNALNQIQKNENVEIIYPVHPNPNIQNMAKKYLKSPNIHLIKPLDYKELVALMKESCIVLTDSGGIQEEAPSLGKPVLVLRKVTERPEAVISGVVKVVGTNTENIVYNANKLINNSKEYEKMANSINPYGDGLASKRINHSIKWYFKNSVKPKDFNPK